VRGGGCAAGKRCQQRDHARGGKRSVRRGGLGNRGRRHQERISKGDHMKKEEGSPICGGARRKELLVDRVLRWKKAESKIQKSGSLPTGREARLKKG